eukprot:784143-Prorocentrum_minimum.AAC.2
MTNRGSGYACASKWPNVQELLETIADIDDRPYNTGMGGRDSHHTQQSGPAGVAGYLTEDGAYSDGMR